MTLTNTMHKETYRSLGLNVTLNVPSSVEEFDSLAKKSGSALENAISNAVYRGKGGLADFRSDFADAVEQATSVKRITETLTDDKGEPKKDAEGNVKTRYTESEQTYFDRVIKETSRTPESFQELADSVAASLVLDPSVTERAAPEPKTPPKKVYATVDQILAAGTEMSHKVATKLAHVLGHHVEADREGLAKAIHEDNLAEAKRQSTKWAPVA
jgi:hypothetical protein